jgi:hypothetical protein
MARFEFDLHADVGPDVVRAALLDFSARRPDLWPGLPRDQYEVYEVGDTWAVVREGYRGPIWWRERYDWSTSGTIRCTALESGFGMPGSYFTWDVTPLEGCGSRVHVVWDRRGRTLFGRLFVGLLWLTNGFFVRRSFEMGLTRIASLGAGREALAR